MARSAFAMGRVADESRASSKRLTLASRSDNALRSAQCRFRRRGNTTDNCYTSSEARVGINGT